MTQEEGDDGRRVHIQPWDGIQLLGSAIGTMNLQDQQGFPLNSKMRRLLIGNYLVEVRLTGII